MFIALFRFHVILNAVYLFIDNSRSVCCVHDALRIKPAGSGFGFDVDSSSFMNLLNSQLRDAIHAWGGSWEKA